MSILEIDPTKCLMCGNPHQLIDEDAGSDREMWRVCIPCWNKKPKEEQELTELKDKVI